MGDAALSAESASPSSKVSADGQGDGFFSKNEAAYVTKTDKLCNHCIEKREEKITLVSWRFLHELESEFKLE